MKKMKPYFCLTICFLFITVSKANFDVMEGVELSFKKMMNNGFFERENHHSSILKQPKNCINGKVTLGDEVFACKEVDFLSFVGMEDLEVPFSEHKEGVGARSADIWGWQGPSGREYTLLSVDNGMVVIDSTDPIQPCILAKMPTKRYVDIWADVKVYNHTAYHVKDTKYFRDMGLDNELDETAKYGIEVYDLLIYEQLSCHAEGFRPLNVLPTYMFTDHGRSHNLIINPESGLLYSVGTEKCNGGFMVIDVKTDRLKPTQVGCAEADNYTHDGQCLTYDGPDTRFTGHEICFGYNEDTLTIWDFTDLNNFQMLSKTFYPNQAFTHQGWVNDKLTKVLLDDEYDELCNNGNPTNSPRCAATSTYLTGHKTTATYVFDITSLTEPFYEGFFDHGDNSVDHNLYVWGNTHRKGWGGSPPMKNHPDPNFAYMNNYLAGLKIVDIHSEDYKQWETVGYFDISPSVTDYEFAGAWSGYMHPSGVYAISSIERGLFLLSPRMAFTEEYPSEAMIAERDENNVPTNEEPEVEETSPNLISSFFATVFVSAFVVLAIILVAMKATAWEPPIQNRVASEEEQVQLSHYSIEANE